MFRLDGKVAIITGGGSGIGKSIATLFGQQGANLMVLDVDKVAAEQTANEINAKGGSAEYHVCDVTRVDQVEQCFKTVFSKQKRLDILVTSAGVSHVGNVEHTTTDDFQRVHDVNVKGVFYCLQAGVKRMKQSGGGAILNLGSIASVIGLADRFAYSMSKGAVLTMTLSIATDYLADNIRCNCVLPARIHTPFVDGYLRKHYPGREQEMLQKLSEYQPMGRMGTPEEVAALALYLCSDEAAFVTGSAYPIDGGVISIP
jgi:2-keto-3-deoxy-L-fuconate dehydrogenase